MEESLLNLSFTITNIRWLTSRILVFLFVLPTLSPGQNPVLDSLHFALEQHPDEGTLRANLLFEIAKEYQKTDLQQMAAYSDTLLTLAEILQDEALLFNAYNLKGNVLSLGYKPVESFQYYLRAQNICAGKEGDEWKKRQTQILINLSSAFWLNDANRTALQYLSRAESLVKDLDEPSIELSIYWASGLVFRSLGKPDSALLYFRQAYEGYRSRADTINQAIMQSQLGFCYYQLARYDRALEQHLAALEVLGRNQVISHQFTTVMGLGQTYLQLGVLQKAYEYAHLSNSLCQKINSCSGILGNNAQTLANVFRQWNQLDSAYYYLQQYTEAEKKEIAGQKEKLATQMELQYVLREKEIENKLLFQENELIRSRNLLYLIIFLALLCISILAVFFLRKFYQKNQQITAQNLSLSQLNQHLDQRHQQLQRLMSEKKHLVSLLTHDLRTPLLLIRLSLHKLNREKTPTDYTTYTQSLTDIGEATKQIDRISQRIMAAEQLEDFAAKLEIAPVSLQEVCRNLREEFLPLARNRNIRLESQAAGDLTVSADPFFLKRAAGNLLSNAVKYAPENSRVVIGSRARAEGVELFVQDEGPGLPPGIRRQILENPLPEFSPGDIGRDDRLHMGLYLTRRYVEAMGAQLLEATEHGGGTCMVIRFPAGEGQLSGNREALSGANF